MTSVYDDGYMASPVCSPPPIPARVSGICLQQKFYVYFQVIVFFFHLSVVVFVHLTETVFIFQ